MTAQASVDDVLEKAWSMRLDNPVAAKQALEQAKNEYQLNSIQRNYHEYISLIVAVRTQSDSLRQTYDKLKVLLAKVVHEPLKIKVSNTILGLAPTVGDWQTGYATADVLQKYISTQGKDNAEAIKDSVFGLVIFFSLSEQSQLALDLINTYSREFDDDNAFRCKLNVKKIDILYHQDVNRLGDGLLDESLAFCQSSENQMMTVFVRLYTFKYLVAIEDFNLAQAMIKDLINDIEALNYPYFDIDFNVHLGQFALARGDLENAQDKATAALAGARKVGYLQSQIEALETLITIAQAQNDYQLSFEYLSELEQARRDFREDKIVKQTAYLQTRFDLSLKEKEIELLDQRNRSLQAQSALAKEREQSSYIIVLFLTVFLAAAFIWMWRSQSIQKQLKQLAHFDALTNALNRGYFVQCVEQSLDKIKSKQQSAALILLDLDHFKRLNDTFGHQTGDWALVEVTKAISAKLPANALFGRMGGEEFAIFLPNHDRHQALQLAEACRGAIEAIDSKASGSQFSVSASFGVSDSSQVGYKFDNLSSAADLALYQSKKFGRNTVYEYTNSAVIQSTR